MKHFIPATIAEEKTNKIADCIACSQLCYSSYIVNISQKSLSSSKLSSVSSSSSVSVFLLFLLRIACSSVRESESFDCNPGPSDSSSSSKSGLKTNIFQKKINNGQILSSNVRANVRYSFDSSCDEIDFHLMMLECSHQSANINTLSLVLYSILRRKFFFMYRKNRNQTFAGSESIKFESQFYKRIKKHSR